MLRQGLLPDGIPYNALVSACGKGGLQQRACEPLPAMHHQGLRPDVTTYSPAISAYAKDKYHYGCCIRGR